VEIGITTSHQYQPHDKRNRPPIPFEAPTLRTWRPTTINHMTESQDKLEIKSFLTFTHDWTLRNPKIHSDLQLAIA
jgi:hypothetical protein